MKKVLIIVALNTFIFLIISCTKSYTCTCETSPGVYDVQDFENLDKVELDSVRTNCEVNGCTWAAGSP